uniref:Dephospho-CoA kinase n=1 Tax=Quercus lobata TaxID=97700 RepID=A0A7N2N6S0_QUELO
MDKWTKPIIVVWVDPETQLRRLMARDRASEEDARNRISAQMSLDLKRTKADIVIDNTGSLEDLNEQFKKSCSSVLGKENVCFVFSSNPAIIQAAALR